MRRLIACVLAVLLGSVILLAQGPLTPLMNLRGRTDANGYLMVTPGAYSGSDGPLTPLSNLRGRTDSNGYLLTAISGGLVNLQTFLFGAATATVGGTLTTSAASTCTIANTNETDLWTYTLPAGSVDADGRGLRVTVWGTTAATANVKTIKFYMNGSQVSQSLSGAANGQRWRFQFMLLRTASTTATYYSIESLTGVADSFQVDQTAVTYAWTSAQIIKMTGQNGTAAANDVCAKGAVVETIK